MEDLQLKKEEEILLDRADVVLKLLTKRGLIPDKKISDDARRAAQQKRQKDSYGSVFPSPFSYRSILLGLSFRDILRMPHLRYLFRLYYAQGSLRSRILLRSFWQEAFECRAQAQGILTEFELVSS